jgi:TRAP-type C4-dicarboxylate transport system permease small subunit
MFALVMGAAFIGFFAWHAVALTYTSWQINDMSTGVLVVPLWLPQLGYSGGLVILFIAFIDELVHVALGGRPRYEKEPPKTTEERIERAIQEGV